MPDTDDFLTPPQAHWPLPQALPGTLLHSCRFQPQKLDAQAFGRHGVDQPLFEAAQAEFGDRALVDLTMAIIAINGWNRLAIAFHSPEAGSYVVPQPSSAHDG